MVTVREIVELIPSGTMVKVFQTPIARIDSAGDPVLRSYADRDTVLGNNQNFHDFEAEKLYQDGDILAILCKASKEQEDRIVAARYEG